MLESRSAAGSPDVLGTGAAEVARPDPSGAAWRRRLTGPAPVLTALVLVVTGLDVYWRTLDGRPPHWDMGNHLGNSVIYLKLFSVSHPLPFLQTMFSYPPLVMWVTDAFYAVTGNEAIWVAVLSNVVWLAMLVYGTYGLGKTLWSARAGLVAVAFVVTTPMMVATFKDYMLDAPLAATVVLATMHLVRSGDFSDRRQSLRLGVACGLGLLVKWTFPVILGLPLFQAASAAFATSRRERRLAPIVNVLAAGACTVAVAGVWYLPNFEQVIKQSREKSYAGAAGTLPAPLSLDSAFWYFWSLIDRQLFLLPFLFFVAGVVYCFRSRDFAVRSRYLILTIVGSYVALTVLRDKDARFTLPMIPAVSLLATAWLEHVSGRLRRALTGVIVVYGAAAFLAISFGVPVLPRDLSIRLGPGAALGDIPSVGFTGLNVFVWHPYVLSGPPIRRSWHLEDAFRAMSEAPPGQRTFASVGPVTLWFNQFDMRYYSWRYDTPQIGLPDARFILVRGDPRKHPLVEALRPRVVDRWHLPDGEQLTLFERR